MKYQLQPYSIHELGQRENQEDSIFPAHKKATANDRLFILCDGMGGHEKGEVASATVCEVMSNAILSRWNSDEPLSDDLLQQAIDDAFDALDAKDNGEAKKMGTTMTFLCLHAEGVTIAHIGDSRVYQLRPAKGDAPASILFKTRDHSLVNDLIKIGEITEEEAKNHPQKNVITRAMLPCQERRAKADIAHLTDIQPGNYFYMCSDGMLEQTTDENLLYIITKKDVSDEQKIEMLREVTSENKDNHTAHLIHIYKVEDVLPIDSSEQEPKGIFITPHKEKPAKSNKLIIILIAVIVVLSLIILGLLFLKSSDVENDSDVKKDSTEVVTSSKVKETSKAKASASKKEKAKSEVLKDEKKEPEVKAENPKKEDAKPAVSSKKDSLASKFLPKKTKPEVKDEANNEQPE